MGTSRFEADQKNLTICFIITLYTLCCRLKSSSALGIFISVFNISLHYSTFVYICLLFCFSFLHLFSSVRFFLSLYISQNSVLVRHENLNELNKRQRIVHNVVFFYYLLLLLHHSVFVSETPQYRINNTGNQTRPNFFFLYIYTFSLDATMPCSRSLLLIQFLDFDHCNLFTL